MDSAKLDQAFEFIQRNTRNGGILVLRHGWLVYERYFGLGHREALPNLASCGKSFTSISVGILMHERPDLFPQGLDQRIFTPEYFPPEAFPLTDPAMAEIKLGQLLAFSAGVRGNNPCYVNRREIVIDPAGPDGWPGMVDEIALGRDDGLNQGGLATASSLWCAPGAGYSYATASIHLASIMLRHITGMQRETLALGGRANRSSRVCPTLLGVSPCNPHASGGSTRLPAASPRKAIKQSRFLASQGTITSDLFTLGEISYTLLLIDRLREWLCPPCQCCAAPLAEI